MPSRARAPCEDKVGKLGNNGHHGRGNRRGQGRSHSEVNSLPAHYGLSWVAQACVPARDDCCATSDNSPDKNSQSEMFDFITLWRMFPLVGDFSIFCGAVTNGATATTLTTAAAMLTREVRSKSS